MRGVVTGGSGFLGSHVSDVLAEAGHSVTVVDIVPTSRHRFVHADLEDPAGLTSAFRGMDYVCHLAAVGDVYLAAERPELAADVNVGGTARVSAAAVSAGVSRLVYASTWEVYGKPTYQPIDEVHPCNPDHPYSITKLAGERLALAYGVLRGLDACVLRLGTAYGARMRSNSVFSIFADRARKGEVITIQGTGVQSRQFTHARDIGNAFLLALTNGKAGGVYNIVGDQSVSIRELAESVIEAFPTSIAFAPARKAEVPSAIVSNALARYELGWTPDVEFAVGLRELIQTRALNPEVR